jgi:phosphinothricin acetyltransferase
VLGGRDDRRVIVRLATPEDGAAMAAIYAPFVAGSAVSFETVPPAPEEMARRIADTLPSHPWLVAADDGQVIGYAYAHPFAERAAYQWSVETSVYVAQASRRSGVGRRLYRALFEILAHQGYARAFAGVTLPNDASIGLHEAMGFTRVAVYSRVGWKHGAWHDVGWWQRDIGEDGRADPGDPVSVLDLDPAAVQAALTG